MGELYIKHLKLNSNNVMDSGRERTVYIYLKISKKFILKEAGGSFLEIDFLVVPYRRE